MREEIKKKWVDALRSGEYKQGRGNLRPTEDTHCCLGVLCDLYKQTRHRGKWVSNDFDYPVFDFFIGGKHESNELPPEVIRWAGLTLSNPVIRINKKDSSLADLNDSKNSNFKKIAKIIEAQL